MAKKKLIWYPNAMYHITSRGNRRNDIYRDNEDYQVYMTILKEAIEYLVKAIDGESREQRMEKY